MIIISILVCLIFLLHILMTISIKIEIDNLKISIPKIKGKYINKSSKITMKFYILRKIKIAEADLKKIKMNDTKIKNRIDKLKQKMIKQNSNLKANINAIEVLRRSNFKMEKLNLKVYLGIEDAAFTAIFSGIISSIISIVLKDKIENLEIQKFHVIPIYENKSILKIELDSIFEFSIANIIDIIKFLKKGRVNKNDRKSYRRAHAYSNE